MKRLLALAFVACRTEAPATPDASPDAAALAFIFADAEPTLTLVPDAGSPEDRLLPFANTVPRSGKSIGHTSVVFRLDFDKPLRAAYKPESKRGHKRYRGEVAAFRLARVFHLPNVPPATVRIFDKGVLRAALGPDAQKLFDDEVIDHDGKVHGALMPWIDKLEFVPLESTSERAKWKHELESGGDIAETDRSMAGQISTLIVFDALTGNWDRWSGGQIGIDRASSTLLFVDNDAAFFEPIPPAFSAQWALVRSVDRFSRSFVARLRSMDGLTLADAFGEEEPGKPLLPARVVADADQRRKDLLAIIDQKIAALGESAVLYFP